MSLNLGYSKLTLQILLMRNEYFTVISIYNIVYLTMVITDKLSKFSENFEKHNIVSYSYCWTNEAGVNGDKNLKINEAQNSGT